MLACSATSALVRPGRGGEGSGMIDRSAYSEIAKMLECGADSVANADQTPAPARGYLQMILAVSQILAADDRGYQVHHKRLLSLNSPPPLPPSLSMI